MEYIVTKRYRGNGIGGYVNLPYGTICTERNGFLIAPDGRYLCAVTSENGWEHFRPNTEEGRRRCVMLDRLYRYYAPGVGKQPEGNAAEDFAPEKWPGAVNIYWKNLLRTMSMDELERYYRERLGEPTD